MSLEHAPLNRGKRYGNDGSGTYAGASGGRRRAPQQPQ